MGDAILDGVIVGAIVGALVGLIFVLFVPKAPCPHCGRKIAKKSKKCARCRKPLELGWASEAK